MTYFYIWNLSFNLFTIILAISHTKVVSTGRPDGKFLTLEACNLPWLLPPFFELLSTHMYSWEYSFEFKYSLNALSFQGWDQYTKWEKKKKKVRKWKGKYSGEKKISKIQKAYRPLSREIFQPRHNLWLVSIFLRCSKLKVFFYLFFFLIPVYRTKSANSSSFIAFFAFNSENSSSCPFSLT